MVAQIPRCLVVGHRVNQAGVVLVAWWRLKKVDKGRSGGLIKTYILLHMVSGPDRALSGCST